MRVRADIERVLVQRAQLERTLQMHAAGLALAAEQARTLQRLQIGMLPLKSIAAIAGAVNESSFVAAFNAAAKVGAQLSPEVRRRLAESAVAAAGGAGGSGAGGDGGEDDVDDVVSEIRLAIKDDPHAKEAVSALRRAGCGARAATFLVAVFVYVSLVHTELITTGVTLGGAAAGTDIGAMLLAGLQHWFFQDLDTAINGVRPAASKKARKKAKKKAKKRSAGEN